MIGNNGTNHLGVNLLFTKFIFVTPSRDDEAEKNRLRAAAATVARGYFNDYEGNGNSDSSPQDSLQFLVSDHVTGIGSVTPRSPIATASIQPRRCASWTRSRPRSRTSGAGSEMAR